MRSTPKTIVVTQSKRARARVLQRKLIIFASRHLAECCARCKPSSEQTWARARVRVHPFVIIKCERDSKGVERHLHRTASHCGGVRLDAAEREPKGTCLCLLFCFGYAFAGHANRHVKWPAIDVIARRALLTGNGSPHVRACVLAALRVMGCERTRWRSHILRARSLTLHSGGLARATCKSMSPRAP